MGAGAGWSVTPTLSYRFCDGIPHYEPVTRNPVGAGGSPAGAGEYGTKVHTPSLDTHPPDELVPLVLVVPVVTVVPPTASDPVS